MEFSRTRPPEAAHAGRLERFVRRFRIRPSGFYVGVCLGGRWLARWGNPGGPAARIFKSWKAGVPGKMSTFTAVVTREEDLYVATCPEVGTVSQGETVEEAVAALKEATELYLEEFKVSPAPRSILTTFEVAEAADA